MKIDKLDVPILIQSIQKMIFLWVHLKNLFRVIEGNEKVELLNKTKLGLRQVSI